ncbi:MAG TPA: peroxidase-related enzyme [Bryobacteraceae bacterium]|nr:peroxidase-related enzyme [Bryobacteraceae bacterium]
MKSLYIPQIEQRPKEGGIYQGLVEKTKANHPEYPKIWDLFAFGEDFTGHLARFTQGVIRTPATISPGMRELIAAYTSRLNRCAFCTKAHAAAASELLGSESLVAAVLEDADASPLAEEEKAMLRFVRKVTLDSAAISEADMEPLYAAGWDDEAIYFAATTCALFNFYNRWISSTGVPPMSDEMHRWQGKLLATGYVRG